jgi:hypothetical protein
MSPPREENETNAFDFQIYGTAIKQKSFVVGFWPHEF